MIRVIRSTVIDAPVGPVWRAIRDFGAVCDWHPLVSASHIEDGLPADRLGCVRHIVTQGGGVIREPLLALSDHDHCFTYAIIESTLPVENYVATLSLAPVTDGDRTFARWSAEFDCDPDKETELDGVVGDGIFQTGFDDLKTRFGTP
jgi:hypothetical protein